ncbi:MAG: T9SS type A sorting domain-containing protein [Bacteroidales bacterium]
MRKRYLNTLFLGLLSTLSIKAQVCVISSGNTSGIMSYSIGQIVVTGSDNDHLVNGGVQQVFTSIISSPKAEGNIRLITLPKQIIIKQETIPRLLCIDIYRLDGTREYSNETNKEETSISLLPGVYILTVKSGNESLLNTKIIIP